MSETSKYYPWQCTCPKNPDGSMREWRTTYGHLRNPCVSVGDIVVKGQKIGEIGNPNTDLPDWPHLHFGLDIGGCSINQGKNFTLGIPSRGRRHSFHNGVVPQGLYDNGLSPWEECFLINTITCPVDLFHCNWINCVGGGETVDGVQSPDSYWHFHADNYYSQDWRCQEGSSSTIGANVYCHSGGPGIISIVTVVQPRGAGWTGPPPPGMYLSHEDYSIEITHVCTECTFCNRDRNIPTVFTIQLDGVANCATIQQYAFIDGCTLSNGEYELGYSDPCSYLGGKNVPVAYYIYGQFIQGGSYNTAIELIIERDPSVKSVNSQGFKATISLLGLWQGELGIMGGTRDPYVVAIFEKNIVVDNNTTLDCFELFKGVWGKTFSVNGYCCYSGASLEVIDVR